MLKFTLLNKTTDEIQYAYYPEGGQNYGIVSYDIKTGNCHIVSLSTDDCNQKYAFIMMRRIRKFAHDGNFEDKGIIAWY